MKRPQNFDELLDIAKKRPDVHGALSQLGKSLKRVGRSMDGIRWQIETKGGTSGDFSAIVFIEMDDGSWKICDNKGRTGQQFIDSITLLREIFHVSFDDAVYMLSGGRPSAPVAKPQKLTLKRKTEPQEKPTYTPPTPAPDKLRNVKAYLIQTRKLPKELVLPLIDSGKIYASDRFKNKIAFCTFPITDENGKNVGTDMAATIDNLPKTYKKHLEKGSNADYAWCFPYEVEEITSETPIFFCEAPIDTMSLCALSGTPGIYVSMAGCKDRTFNSVTEKLGGTPIICVDNDETGNAFAARHPDVPRMVAPIGKDWNDTLKHYVENNMSYAFAPPDAAAAPDVPLEENVAHVHYESEEIDPKKENGALDEGASVDEEIQADKGLLKFINDIEQMQDKSLLSKRSYNIGLISENHRILLECLFKNEFNIEHDFSGYSMQINGSAVSHIQKRHGKNGNADQTMANDEDIAKLGIIANSADEFEVLRKADGSIDTSAEFRNKKGERSPKIALKKSIDNNTFVVIECVPESNKKTIHIVSARKEKGGIGQVLNIEANASPQLTSKTPVDYPATTNIVPENTEKVNTLDEKNSKPLNDEDPPIADNNEKHSPDELRTTLEAKVADVVNNYRADPRALDKGASIQDKAITMDMPEEERAKILRNKTITPCNIEIHEDFNIDWEALENNRLDIIKTPLLHKLRELGFLKQYNTSSINIEFSFTRKGLKKSINSQAKDYGGSLADLSKVVMNMQNLLDSSVLIEVHSDKAKGTPKENEQLIQTYVLLSAYKEPGTITPVQFEIKQYIDNDNRLYLAVAMTKREEDVVNATIQDKSQASPRLLSPSTYSIAEFIEKINPKDENFFKYIPNSFLSEEQKQAKANALAREAKKYGRSLTEEKPDNPPLNDEAPIGADNNEKHSQDELRTTLEAKVADVVNNYRTDPRALAEYVIFSSRFNNYSANNLRLIWAQYPYAQYVTSAYDFSHGLPGKDGKPTVSEKIFIKKGERALRIWKPYDVKYTVMPDGTEKRSAWLTKSEREQAKAEKWKELTRKYFTLVPVFDITQTTASPDVYPKLCGLGGVKGTSADARFNALKNYCENVLNCPVKVRDFGERKATVRGSFYPNLNEIHISDMLEGENKLSTFIHELGHATLHADSYKNASKSTARIEVEADIYSFIIECRLGIEPTDARCRHLKTHYDQYLAEINATDINADNEIFNSVIDCVREQIPLIDAYVDNLNVKETQTNTLNNVQDLPQEQQRTTPQKL